MIPAARPILICGSKGFTESFGSPDVLPAPMPLPEVMTKPGETNLPDASMISAFSGMSIPGPTFSILSSPMSTVARRSTCPVPT